ncbi:MAG: DUF3298 domain-containing protein [Oscillospiraceae bacterium]|nr:DUF3298 domain-containing protein [Oscillospiraceae bacterium]
MKNRKHPMRLALALLLAGMLAGSVCVTAGAEDAGAAAPVGEALEHPHGTIVHYAYNTREAMDPENGTELILSMTWDSLRVESDIHPEAAAAISETLAGMEDAWYIGESDPDMPSYGYNTMLGTAEDDYAVRREYGGEIVPLESDRTHQVLRADDEVLVLMSTSYVYLGGAHGSTIDDAICFDMRTGEKLVLEDLAADAEELKTALVQEMVKLAEEDRDGYYSDQISFVEPADYHAAFAALLRDGAWYPGNDGFHLFSDQYELGPYAAGMTDFVIPYESLEGILDARWIPQEPAGTAAFTVVPEAIVPKGQTEIVDLVNMAGDSTENAAHCLLLCEGEAKDVTLLAGGMQEGYGADGQPTLFFWETDTLWYGETLCDNALQLDILFPGDLPTSMLRYRDAAGVHELLFSLSGLDGSVLLTENTR